MGSVRRCSTSHAATTPSNSRAPVTVAHSRRTVLQGTLAAALQLTLVSNSQAAPNAISSNEELSPYVQGLVKRSQEMKEQRDKERLEAYYKKNFKDYFEFEGSDTRAAAARGISSETQQAIARWLEKNQ